MAKETKLKTKQKVSLSIVFYDAQYTGVDWFGQALAHPLWTEVYRIEVIDACGDGSLTAEAIVYDHHRIAVIKPLDRFTHPGIGKVLRQIGKRLRCRAVVIESQRLDRRYSLGNGFAVVEV